MRKLIKFGMYFLGTIGLFLILVALVAFFFFPRDIPVESLEIAHTQERIERGRYLVNHVARCLDCHADRDWQYTSGPIIPETLGRGGITRLFGDDLAAAANITPYALGDWSDGELKRALTSGLKPTGKLLHPEMPYFLYNDLVEEDLHGIIAYLRNIKPINYDPPAPEWPLWIYFLARFVPKPYEPPPPPDPKDTVGRGQYLVRLASCELCHNSDLSGGIKFDIPGGGTVYSANISPDSETGIGSWKKEDFIAFFKAFDNEEAKRMKPPEPDMNTVMPWTQFAGMTESDLGAIYDYLRTQAPVVKAYPQQP